MKPDGVLLYKRPDSKTPDTLLVRNCIEQYGPHVKKCKDTECKLGLYDTLGGIVQAQDEATHCSRMWSLEYMVES